MDLSQTLRQIAESSHAIRIGSRTYLDGNVRLALDHPRDEMFFVVTRCRDRRVRKDDESIYKLEFDSSLTEQKLLRTLLVRSPNRVRVFSALVQHFDHVAAAASDGAASETSRSHSSDDSGSASADGEGETEAESDDGAASGTSGDEETNVPPTSFKHDEQSQENYVFVFDPRDRKVDPTVIGGTATTMRQVVGRLIVKDIVTQL